MNLRILAVVLTLAAAGLAVALWREHATATELVALTTRLARQSAELRYDATQAAKQAEEFRAQAVTLDSLLGSAKSRTTATESRHFQLTRELSETRSRLTEREQREVALLTELAALRQKIAAAATPPVTSRRETADGTANERRIAELEQRLTELLVHALAEAANAPAEVTEAVPAATAPFQVVRVGPQDTFVVLDYGADHGARRNEILHLWRGTSELARVQISDARPRFSLAKVLPATLKGQLQTGDLVVLTN